MKKITLLAFLATFSLAAFAQGGERGPYLTNRFFDNWFISAAGGANMYMGEWDRRADLGKRLAPALDVSAGKWFTPSVGARLMYSGLSARGGTTAPDAFFATGETVTGGKNGTYYTKEFNYSFVHADFLWNASTSLGGYKESRLWEFIPFVGFGPALATRTSNSAACCRTSSIFEFGATAGLLNKIRLSGALDLTLEARGAIFKQSFDGVAAGRRGEAMASVTAGLSYKFGRRDFSKPVAVAPADYSSYNDRIRGLEGEVNSQRARADQLARDLAAARNVTPPAPAGAEVIFPDHAIFFAIGSATLSAKEQVNVNFIAEAIKRMPAGRKVTLEGYADSATGTASGNMTLSERRVKTVYDALIAAGVRADQIEFMARGDTSEPFGRQNPELNRVIIIEQP